MDTPLYSKILGLSIILALLLIISVQLSYCCNEEVCASIVSKCMLTQSCKCDAKNFSCSSECFKCLSHLSTECCSCVEMCPKSSDTRNVSRQSHVGELEGIPGLFQALTEGNDKEEDSWSTFTFPVDFETALFGSKGEKRYEYIWDSADQSLDTSQLKLQKNIMTYNCTVVYMAQCVSLNKCKRTCQSMGATSFRWFFDGCCECVGSMCINYGIRESRCTLCPEAKDEESLDDPPQDELDFGENNL